jgi:hypothetical protein
MQATVLRAAGQHRGTEMKKLALVAAFATAATLATAAMSQEDDMVCLITFSTAAEAEAGANATALSGVFMTRAEANLQASELTLIREFDQELCEGPTFNPDLRDDDDATNSARAFAPGQLKGEGESARDYAPGQLKEDGESARDHAPGQVKKSDGSDNDD